MTTETTIVDELALARDAARGDDWPRADGNPPDYLRAIAYPLIDLADSARFCTKPWTASAAAFLSAFRRKTDDR